MKAYPVASAKTHLSEIIRDAERGEVIALTRRGEPVARVISEADFRRLDALRAPARKLNLYEAIAKFLDENGPIDFTEEELALFEDRGHRDRPNPFLD